jgi:cytidylate kinase
MISIEEEWQQMQDTENMNYKYNSIYKIKIHEVSLRELLIMQSFYLTKTITDIVNLI